MEFKIDDTTAMQLQKMIQDLEKFTALYEQNEDRLEKKAEEFNSEMMQFRQEINAAMQSIHSTLTEFSEFMTATGAARLRVNAEEILNQGQGHAKVLADLVAQFKILSERSASRLERVSIEAEKRIAKIVSALAIEQDDVVEQFREKAEKSYAEVNKTLKDTSGGIKKIFNRFRWEQIGIALGSAILASLFIGLYLNAELPWESFSRSHQERQIGSAVIRVLPTLNADEQQQFRKLFRIEPPLKEPNQQ